MATLELALGGLPTFNAGYNVYPQVPNPNVRSFAMHKAHGMIYLNRVLDFHPITGDLAMQEYAKATLAGGVFVAADVIKIGAIPAPAILLATHAQVIVPEAGFTFALHDAAGAIATVPSIVGNVAGHLFSPAGPTLKNYATNSMMSLVVSAAGAAFPTKLKISVCGIFLDPDARPL